MHEIDGGRPFYKPSHARITNYLAMSGAAQLNNAAIITQ